MLPTKTKKLRWLPPFQVKDFRAKCSLSKDDGAIHSDAWGCKRLFSYGCRKSGVDKDLDTSPARRDPCFISCMYSTTPLGLPPVYIFCKTFKFHGPALQKHFFVLPQACIITSFVFCICNRSPQCHDLC